ncbi:APC membrane recruitment protein 2 [Channa argus]|uniref:APC membrane recruitment protein 2 n=1 Tax=Channa argus TaxID=215402 RepID=A0A6G1QVG3_CHAAH|nr:APC membrane recruitment protein 2 [Channa argus]KAK2879594.1 hypothetical protein Q8A73_023406 [Channa argus]
MDVQTENMDPPPCESQPSGKIRKGFKLFGKRKPGNIFSIRSKGDGNNKSPVIRSKTLDGLSETEREPDKENGQEVSQGEREHSEEEQLAEDGVLAAAPARTSISSACSAKSLSFLSLLRGGHRGLGENRVHTVSQPVGRQRRGLKGLFGNVKFRSKDKDDKEEVPPSPLLMSSRANSVEIIKEDLTLTPKSQPRSLDSPESNSYDPLKNFTSQDSPETSPSETTAPQVTASNVSRTNEHVPCLLTRELPGDNSLSSLLADISSLLTFDSISGGGDIMADVEAEWGKASSAISTVVTEATPSLTSVFSKPTISSPFKPSPVVIPATGSTQSFTPLTKTTSTSSPIAKPSTIISTLTKSCTLTTNTVKLSSDSTPVSESSASIQIKSTPMPTATKPSTSHVALTSISAPIISSPQITIKSTESSTSTAITLPPNTPASVVKVPSISPTVDSIASKVTSDITAPAQVAPVSKSTPVATPPPSSAKPPPITHSPPTPVSFTQHQPAKLQTFTSSKPSLNSTAVESKGQVTVSPACAVTATLSSPTPVIVSNITTAPTTSGSTALFKPTITSAPMDLNKAPPPLVTVPDPCLFSTPNTTIKPQLSPASVPTPSSTLSDKIPSTTKPTSAPLSLDKMPPALTQTQVPATLAVISTASPTPADLVHIPVSQFKAPTAPAQIPFCVLKDSPASAQIQVSQCKIPPSPPPIPVSVLKDPRVATQMAVLDPSAPTPSPCPVTALPSSPALCLSQPPASAKMKGSRQASVDGQLTSPNSKDTQGADNVLCKPEELHESWTGPPASLRERRAPHVKASGLSKIPVVGGGRGGKLPVRDSQHVDDEASRVPPTPVPEERPHSNSHDAGNKDNICDAEADMPTSKHTQQESQQPPQPKVLTSLPRDSKIPVKHSTQSHTASQIPQAKEALHTKIPVSKIPVRWAGNKPATSGGSTHIRK